MKNRAVTLVASVYLAAVSSFAQANEWRLAMDRGNQLRHEGKYREALVSYQEAVRLAEGLPSEPLRLASSLNSAGLIYDELSRPLEAEQTYRRTLAILEKAAGVRSVGRAQVLVNLSGVYLRQGLHTKAEEILREAIGIYSDLVPSDATLVAAARDCLAEALLRKGAYQEAETVVRQALAVFEKSPGDNDGYLGMTISDLGAVRWAEGFHEEGAQLFEQAVAMLERNPGPQYPILIYPLNNLGLAYTRLGRTQEAIGVFGRALPIIESCLGTDHPAYGEVMVSYAACLKKLGRKAEGKKLEARGHAVLKESARKNGSGMTVDVSAFRLK